MRSSWILGALLWGCAITLSAGAELRQASGNIPSVPPMAGAALPGPIGVLPQTITGYGSASALLDVSLLAQPQAATPAAEAAPAEAQLPAPLAASINYLQAALPEPGKGTPQGIGSSLENVFDGAHSGAELSRVSLLNDPGEAFDARASLISGAKSTVYAGYFAFFPDAAGLAKLALLRDAARQGRQVRLILDAWGNKLPKAMLKHLIDEGVEIRFYHPHRFDRLSWLWRRSHDKWTVVDGEEMILGDRNMANQYLGIGKSPWISREAYVAGPAARKAQAYAEAMWNGKEVGQVKGLERVSDQEAALAGWRLNAYDAHFERRKADEAFALRPWSQRARSAPVRFSHNALSEPSKHGGTGRDLLRMIRRAKSTIVIENSYVVLPEVFRLELAKAIRDRGVRVVLVTNSYKTNNLRTAREAYEADVPMLIKMGIELYEYKGPGTLHAKGMVVDGKRTYLGSFNLDSRSWRLNTETGIIVDGPEFASDLLKEIEATRRKSTMVGWKGKWMVPRRGLTVLSFLWGLVRRFLTSFVRGQV
jgi:putative cardiolipin synthase